MNKLKSIFSALAIVVTLVFTTQNLFAQDMMQSGMFTGMSDHETSGTVEVVKTDDGYIIKLGADFSLDGAPDPKVAFGVDGEFDAATLIAPLKSDTGEQSYAVPDSIDVSKYNEVYIWCEKFSVGLGVASLK